VLGQHASTGKGVALLVDTFNGNFENDNVLAAGRLLAKAGYTIHILEKRGRGHCCGRTYLAAGMVEAARQKLGALVDDAAGLAESGIAIVGLEPSCLLTLRDEALAMGLGPRAKIVAANAFLLEEFLAREIRGGRFTLLLKAAGAPILVHGHCHQKAFDAVMPIMEVLKLIPDANPKLIETSCCGMAGSFGYDASHYKVSMAMAELSLLPTIRNAPDAIVVADGTSCRAQIAHGTGRDAIHVAALLDRLS